MNYGDSHSFTTVSSRVKSVSIGHICQRYMCQKSSAISINKQLAEELRKLKPSRRTMQLEKCFNRILDSLPEKAIIKDIDVMFNPAYKVDVIRILVEANKRHPFSLIWSGRYDDNRLLYSEEEFADYKAYEISNYDLVCVV